MPEKITRKSRYILAERFEKASDLTSAQKCVLRTLLFKFFNVKTFECFPSDKKIMAQTGLSEKTVRRARKALIATGWIESFSRPADKRRRNYRFPMLVDLIQSTTEAAKCNKNAEPKHRSNSPIIPVKMTSTPIYNKTTPKNLRQDAPLGRYPVVIGSREHKMLNHFLLDEALPLLEDTFDPSSFDEKSVYWLKYPSPPSAGTVEYKLARSWFEQEANQSNINQKVKHHG